METNKKQTAVKYLIDMINYTSIDTLIALHNCGYLDKAEEMEYEQHKDTWMEAQSKCTAQDDEPFGYRTFEQYYQETYGN